MVSNDISLSILCFMNKVYLLSKLSASYLKFLSIPFCCDYFILPNNLNKYLQKWISLINCLDIPFIVYFLIYGFADVGYISVPILVVLKEIFYVFLDEGVLVFGKLNLENNWFFGEVRLVFKRMFLSWFCILALVSVSTLDTAGLNVYFLSS